MPIQKKQALSIVAVKLADWIPASDANPLTHIKGVKSTRVICRAKYQLFDTDRYFDVGFRLFVKNGLFWLIHVDSLLASHVQEMGGVD